MAITEQDKQRLNLTSPAANDVKLGDIIQTLQGAGGGGGGADWVSITGKPATFAPTIGTTATTAAAGNHAHAVAAITGLQAALDAKLTATKGVSQANSTATDITVLVADFNALLAKLRTAGVIAP